METRIYVDLEYCYPGMTRETGRPSAKDLRQVVQIAAVKYDHEGGQELADFNILVRPPFTRPLPEFFVELTGITDKQVQESAVDFMPGLAQFAAFCGDIPIFTFDKDWEVLQQNCLYHTADFPFAGKPFTRVKPTLPAWGINPDNYSSGTLYKAAGLHMQGHVHNALHDVRSMAAALHYFDSVSRVREANPSAVRQLFSKT